MDNELDFKGADKLQAVVWFTRLADSLDADKEYTITVKERKRKRSLNSNSYAWVLLGKLAEKLRIPKTDIYRNYVKEIGGNTKDIVCVQDKALDKLRSTWESNGLGWVTDTLPSKIDGCTNVILYYGSSTYDVEQMNRLIQLIVQDCKEFGIETMSPEELDRLLDLEYTKR